MIWLRIYTRLDDERLMITVLLVSSLLCSLSLASSTWKWAHLYDQTHTYGSVANYTCFSEPRFRTSWFEDTMMFIFIYSWLIQQILIKKMSGKWAMDWCWPCLQIWVLVTHEYMLLLIFSTQFLELIVEILLLQLMGQQKFTITFEGNTLKIKKAILSHSG